jgi:Holliday junction resolvasome RuvABC endonuclease subunit
MKTERVLSLDVSTKTGYCFGISMDSGIVLEEYKTIPQIHQPEGVYPGVYVDWSIMCFKEIEKIIVFFKPDVLVIEETSKGSKNAMSQKLLEYLHYNLANYIKDTGIKSVYIMTEQWRREIGCKMSKEEKIRNKEVRKYKEKNKTSIAYDTNGKRTGLIGRKHVNIRRINEIFANQLKEPLKRKDEDQADALGLLASYHMRRLKNNNSEEISMQDLIGES